MSTTVYKNLDDNVTKNRLKMYSTSKIWMNKCRNIYLHSIVLCSQPSFSSSMKRNKPGVYYIVYMGCGSLLRRISYLKRSLLSVVWLVPSFKNAPTCYNSSLSDCALRGWVENLMMELRKVCTGWDGVTDTMTSTTGNNTSIASSHHGTNLPVLQHLTFSIPVFKAGLGARLQALAQTLPCLLSLEQVKDQILSVLESGSWPSKGKG